MSASMSAHSQAKKIVDWIQIYTTTVSLIGAAILILALLNLPEDWVGVLVFS